MKAETEEVITLRARCKAFHDRIADLETALAEAQEQLRNATVVGDMLGDPETMTRAINAAQMELEDAGRPEGEWLAVGIQALRAQLAEEQREYAALAHARDEAARDHIGDAKVLLQQRDDLRTQLAAREGEVAALVAVLRLAAHTFHITHHYALTVGPIAECRTPHCKRLIAALTYGAATAQAHDAALRAATLERAAQEAEHCGMLTVADRIRALAEKGPIK